MDMHSESSTHFHQLSSHVTLTSDLLDPRSKGCLQIIVHYWLQSLILTYRAERHIYKQVIR